MATQLARPKDTPWRLKTASGTSEYTMHTDEKDGKKILVCTVGNTVLHYDARCIDDLHAMLKKAGDWVELGGADEQKPAKDGTDGGTPGPGWRKCTAYRQTGPGGPPLGLGLNEGLGISSRGRQDSVYLPARDSAPRSAPKQEQSRYSASAGPVKDFAWRSAPCSGNPSLEFLTLALRS